VAVLDAMFSESLQENRQVPDAVWGEHTLASHPQDLLLLFFLLVDKQRRTAVTTAEI
jgi:hypothetical protein